MKNHFAKLVGLQRRNWSNVGTTALLDRGIDPMETFSIEEHAKRKELGDIAFAVEVDSQDSPTGQLYFVPEISAREFHDTIRVMSLNVISLSTSDYGEIYEVTNTDEDFRIVGWDEGMRQFEHIASQDKAIAESHLFRMLKEVDEQPSSGLSAQELRSQVGMATGFRQEASL